MLMRGRLVTLNQSKTGSWSRMAPLVGQNRLEQGTTVRRTLFERNSDCARISWHNEIAVRGSCANRLRWLLLWLVTNALCLVGATATRAAISISTDSPTAFFTNVADRLLTSELGVSLYSIEI